MQENSKQCSGMAEFKEQHLPLAEDAVSKDTLKSMEWLEKQGCRSSLAVGVVDSHMQDRVSR